MSCIVHMCGRAEAGPLLSRVQVARLLRVAPPVVDYYRRRGLLKSIPIPPDYERDGFLFGDVVSARDAFGIGSGRRSFLSRSQVARLLRVKEPVVGWYVKKGYLCPIRLPVVGSIVGYDTDEVLRARDELGIESRRKRGR